MQYNISIEFRGLMEAMTDFESVGSGSTPDGTINLMEIEFKGNR